MRWPDLFSHQLLFDLVNQDQVVQLARHGGRRGPEVRVVKSRFGHPGSAGGAPGRGRSPEPGGPSRAGLGAPGFGGGGGGGGARLGLGAERRANLPGRLLFTSGFCRRRGGGGRVRTRRGVPHRRASCPQRLGFLCCVGLGGLVNTGLGEAMGS